jgi:hypothetical protein
MTTQENQCKKCQVNNLKSQNLVLAPKGEITKTMSNSNDKNMSAPRWHTDDQYPSEPFAEILPGLFMGGTADDETVDYAQDLPELGAKNIFDAVVTLYSWAQPMGWGVEEMRYGFADASVDHFDTDRLLRVSKWAFERWNTGEKVLIRCQAGLNRSGLVTVLTMMHAGYEPTEAIELVRTKRSQMALFNHHFVSWLIDQAPGFFEQESSSSAA